MNKELIFDSLSWENIIDDRNIQNLSKEGMSFFIKDYLFEQKKDSLKQYTTNICTSIVRNCFDQLQQRASNFRNVVLDDNLAVGFDLVCENLKDKNSILRNSTHVYWNFERDVSFCKSLLGIESYTGDFRDDYVLYPNMSKEFLSDAFKSIKRSDGYMEKRWYYASAMLNYGLIDEDSFKLFTKNLSKVMRQKAFEVTNHLINTVRNIIEKGEYDKYRFTEDEFKSLLFSYKMICFNTVKDLDYFAQRNFIRYIRYEDLPYLIPLSSNFRYQDMFFDRVDELRKQQEKKKGDN